MRQLSGRHTYQHCRVTLPVVDMMGRHWAVASARVSPTVTRAVDSIHGWRVHVDNFNSNKDAPSNEALFWRTQDVLSGSQARRCLYVYKRRRFCSRCTDSLGLHIAHQRFYDDALYKYTFYLLTCTYPRIDEKTTGENYVPLPGHAAEVLLHKHETDPCH